MEKGRVSCEERRGHDGIVVRGGEEIVVRGRMGIRGLQGWSKEERIVMVDGG